MRRLSTLAATAALTVLTSAVVAPTAAFAHETGQAVVEDETTPIERISDNMELVAHHFFPEGSDMMFQRREGAQLLRGEVIDDVRDYAFVGGDAKNATVEGAMHVFDVTDPTLPVHLAAIPCSGYHGDAMIYENLFVQAIDSAGTNGGCDKPERFDPDGKDRPGEEGLRIFDVTDPADPYIVDFLGIEDGIPGGVHNATVVPWAGLLYLSGGGSDPLYIVDLESDDYPIERVRMDKIDGGTNAQACHDIGLDPERELAFCAARNVTLIWDISDPLEPAFVSSISNDLMYLHHGARLASNGTTLVLNDELLGATDENVPVYEGGVDAGVGTNGCLGPGSGDRIGALWFYDISDPANPVAQGSFTPDWPDPTSSPCTSHFYNFVPGADIAVVGWYEGGTVLVDFSDPNNPVEHGVFLPQYGNFWASYYYRGYVYGLSRTIRDKAPGGGLWVTTLEGHTDPVAPAAPDMGTVWSPWTSQLDVTAADTGSDPSSVPATAEQPAPLPTTGGGAALVGLGVLGLAEVVRRRRR